MNYKAFVYVITFMASLFSISGLNYEKLIKKNKVIETKILIVLLSMAISYLTTNFITDFLEVSKIINV